MRITQSYSAGIIAERVHRPSFFLQVSNVKSLVRLHNEKAIQKCTRGIAIREMRVDDIAKVYRLGHRLFKSQEASTFYRTWDAYEVTNNFNQDPHLTLVAQSRKSRIVGLPWARHTGTTRAAGSTGTFCGWA